MLTVAYCRVSTEEQATEGYSIEGQADKLRAYAQLHDQGPVTVVADPGKSGKDLERPGLQQILAMVEVGHVDSVLVWRLDRLSRNLGDLILLSDRFVKLGIGLHSVNESFDLSSATGRMYFNIIGSFAQFYREQLAENVRMGMHQAVREGKWVNRPKTGYDLIGGELLPNGDAERVREIFKLRGGAELFGDRGPNRRAVLDGVRHPRLPDLLGRGSTEWAVVPRPPRGADHSRESGRTPGSRSGATTGKRSPLGSGVLRAVRQADGG